MGYSEKEVITYSEFLECKIMIDSLDKYGCDYYNKFDGKYYYSVTSLTFLFGKICYITNTPTAIKAFLDYRIKHIGSAEEQISFSFEPLFSLNPKLILEEIFKQDEGLQKALLNSLVWGFLNNHYLGIEDPYKDDPFKAMTVYDETPEPIMNQSNYKEIFYKVHPQTKLLYTEYQETFDYIFNEIKLDLEWQEEMNEKMKEKNNK